MNMNIKDILISSKDGGAEYEKWGIKLLCTPKYPFGSSLVVEVAVQ